MTDELKPSQLLAFEEAINGPRGELDEWLECNNEAEVKMHVKAAIAKARQEERERCAKVCDKHKHGSWNSDRCDQAKMLADAIRQLGDE